MRCCKTMLGINETAVKEAIYANAEAARQIAKIQKDAAEQIDRRTRSMVPLRRGGELSPSRPETKPRLPPEDQNTFNASGQ